MANKPKISPQQRMDVNLFEREEYLMGGGESETTRWYEVIK